MLAKFDRIEVLRVTDPIDKDELMLGSVEGAHSSIGFVPDAEV